MKSLMSKSILGGFAMLCAASPFLSVATADKKELEIQPDWRWQEPRNRDEDDNDDRDWNRRNRDDDEDWDRDNGGRLVWLRGFVTRTSATDRFEIRTDQGLTYRVFPDAGQERFPVRVGERVRVRGTVDGSTLLAQHIEYDRSIARRPDGDWSDGGGWSGDEGWRNDPRNETGTRSVNFPATVESRESSYRLTVRGDNGRLYLIESRSILPRGIAAGSRVRVQGAATDNRVRMERVILIEDDRQGPQYVNFRGTVESVEDFNRLRVRADNGRIYTVRSQRALNIQRGDRVRVRGNYSRGLITVTTVERV
ncbi:MAG: hypothetical protein JWN98_1110 [Abditibacteriota bacterium]|nr:hypothetical protein [Abditibacteriota bacterium]